MRVPDILELFSIGFASMCVSGIPSLVPAYDTVKVTTQDGRLSESLLDRPQVPAWVVGKTYWLPTLATTAS